MKRIVSLVSDPPKIRERHWVVIILVGWLVLLSVDRFGLDRRAPVLPRSTEILTPEVHAGGVLYVRSYREKVREDCPIVAFRRAVRDDGLTVPLPGSAWSGGPAGDPYFDFTIKLPPWVPAGRYSLEVDAIYQCPQIAFTVSFPPAEFEVVE